MFIGQTIVAEDATGTTIYSPWFWRQGDGMTSAAEVIAMSSASVTELTISILDKNSDQTGDAPNGAVGSFDTITAAGTSNKRVSGLRELVRYKIVLKRKVGTGTGTIYAHLRLLAPSWETSGAQGN